ncbi:hypothetical protein Hanom_Chr10g00903111 [Helianthus anomalus]
MSDSCTSLLFPTTWSISFCALFIMFGWLMSSANAHSVVIAEVSVPASNISCNDIHCDTCYYFISFKQFTTFIFFVLLKLK